MKEYRKYDAFLETFVEKVKDLQGEDGWPRPPRLGDSTFTEEEIRAFFQLLEVAYQETCREMGPPWPAPPDNMG